MNSNDMKTPLTLIDYASIVWRRRRMALLAAAGFACVTFVAFNFVPRKYTTQAEFERRGDVVSIRTDRKVPESFRNLKPTLRHELTGVPAIRAALADLGYLDKLPSDILGQLTTDSNARFEGMIATIQRDLEIRWLVNSDNVDRVSISFRSCDPVLAHRLPNQLIANYIDATSAMLREQLSASVEFLTDNLNASRAKVEELRRQRYAFAADHPDMMPDNPRFFGDRLSQIDAELDDLRQRSRALETQMAVLKGFESNNGSVAMVANPEYTAAAASMEQLRRQIDESLTVGQMTAKHPTVVKLQEALALAQNSMLTIPSEVPARVAAWGRTRGEAMAIELTGLQNELDRLAGLIARKEEHRERFETSQANLLPVIQEYQRLGDMISDAEKGARGWQDNLADVQMALAAEVNGTRTHLNVVKLAAPSYRPSWPPLWMVFAVAIGGGLTFGVLLVIGRTLLGRCFSSAPQLGQALGLPVLGVIGPIYSPARQRLNMLRRYALGPALMGLLLATSFVAAAGVVLATKYPGRYAQMMESFSPTARTLFSSIQGAAGVL